MTVKKHILFTFFWHHLNGRKLRLLLLLLLRMGDMLCVIYVAPLMLQSTIDSIGTASTNGVFYYLFYYFLFINLGIMSGLLEDGVRILLFNSLQKSILLELSQHLWDNDWQYFMDNYSGDLSVKLANITRDFEKLFRTVFDIVSRCLLFMVVMMHIAHFNSMILPITIVWVLVVYFARGKVSALREKRLVVVNQQISDSIGVINDCMVNFINIAIFSTENREKRSVRHHKNLIIRAHSESILPESILHLLYYLLTSSYIFLLLLPLWLQLKNGLISLGSFAAMLQMVLMLTGNLNASIEQLLSVAAIKVKLLAALEKIYQKQRIVDKPAAKELALKGGGIVFNEVSFGYNKSQS